MKKHLLILMSAFIIFSLAACGQDEKKQTPLEETENNEDTGTTEPDNTGENVVDEEQDGTGTNDSAEQGIIDQSIEDKTFEAKSFKDVKIKEQNDAVAVSGKASVFEGVFQYAIVANGENLKEDHYQTAGAPEWGDFEFSIDKKILGQSDTHLELFVYSAKDGTKQDVLIIPLTGKNIAPASE